MMTKTALLAGILINSALGQLQFGQIKEGSTSKQEITVEATQKFFNFNQCCRNSARYCKRPCAGQSCDAGCRVKCGLFGSLCPAVSCSLANPAECTTGGGSGGSTSSCDAGYTLAGSRCYKLVSSSSNYLQAILGCERMGASLATIDSQDQQDALFSLTGAAGAWIGFTDFLNEGTFSWVDESPVAYTNWRSNAPNNGNNNQHCTWIRSDGEWDDVLCQLSKSYVCQKNARP